MNHNWGGNNQKKRARDNGGWGAYYKNKNANKKDRYAEFDSSTSRAINAGQQPTLARKRRQLAQDNNKWGNYEISNKRAEEIFQDLTRSHRENKSFSGGNSNRIKANPMLINARKNFWRRRLSDLSTRDYDSAWKEGRNTFLKFINNQGNEAVPSTDTPHLASLNSTGVEPKERGALKDPPPGGSNKSKKAIEDSKTKKAKKKSDQNHGAKSSKSATETSKPNVDVIDLCDSDSDRDENIDSSQTNEQVHATGTENNSKQVLTKTEADVSEAIPELNPPRPDLDHTPTSTAVESNTSLQEDLNASTTAQPVVTRKKSIANRWSNLFLGPNFRTDHVFSLDNCNI